MVPRYTKVRVKAKLEDGTEVRIKATDELARTLLHEIDHLNGVLFYDRIDKQNPFKEIPDSVAI
jgi:peptide deformylase